ncbi:MAG: aspartate--tRNA ligase [Candidatus Eremiobacteraeota bacterium]|nr:aspartate--tRNA ligase [Candidatus Eremiobacteraeota bacterium]
MANVRTSCGGIGAGDVGASVDVRGWVNRRRDHGGLVFIDVRDRDGITQAVFDPEVPEAFALAQTLRSEDVVTVVGTVRARPAGTENAKLATGAVEVAVRHVEILSRSLTPPFPINVENDVDESLRLKYRYLDLRRPRLQRNLRVRHRIVKAMRDFFDARDFLEIETPCLIKATPEGARDYIVPSRVHAGAFYALPQSPQLLKQILMVGGLGRYMQIARCFRDEDSRADRQPEFTQLDVEMSFVDENDVMAIMEDCIAHVWRTALGIEIPRPIVRIPHAEALARYGSDKPDLRFDLELRDVRAAFAGTSIKFLQASADDADGAIVAVPYPGGAALSRRDFDALTEAAKGFGAGGLIWISYPADGWKSSIQKLLDDATVARIRDLAGANEGDALLLVAGTRATALDVAGKLRVAVAERLGLRDAAAFAFAWVVGFPLFERDAESGAVVPTHHPFTAPAEGQAALLETDPLAMRAQHYDLVLNGFELGSGSIRIHDAEFQKKIFEVFGLSDAEIDDRFGFFMEALRFGAPPHGGMAWGVDRLAMLACGETSIRDVIAFPKNQVARDLMMEAPSTVPDQTLRDLNLELKRKPSPPPAPVQIEQLQP